MDSKGSVWLGSLNGVTRLERSATTNRIGQFTAARHGLARGDVRTILEAPDGIIWICTREGLSKYEGNQFTTKMIPIWKELGVALRPAIQASLDERSKADNQPKDS